MDMRPTDIQPAPYFDDIAKGPTGGLAHWVQTEDGLRIRVGHWLPENRDRREIKGTVLIFPGRTEYVEKYGPAAADICANGYAVVAVDWRGQGIADRMLPDRRLGHVEKFTDFQKDVAAVLRFVADLDLPKPWFLLAHSMGGAIGLRALMEGMPVKACVFTGPMWGIQIPPTMRPIATLLGAIAPLFGISGMRVPTTTVGHYVETTPFDGNTLTTDPEMYALMQEQLRAQPDLTLGGPTVNWLTEGIRECAQLAKQSSPTLPCITFLGSDEQIVNSEAIHDRMNRWPGGELEVIKNGQHEIVMEGPPIRAHVVRRMTTLFDQYRSS